MKSSKSRRFPESCEFTPPSLRTHSMALAIGQDGLQLIVSTTDRREPSLDVLFAHIDDAAIHALPH